MHLATRACLCLLPLALLQPAHAAGVRNITLVNASPHTITGVASRAPGDDWATADIDALGADRDRRITLRSGRCRQDVKFTFEDGREIVRSGIDLCRHGGLRVDSLSPHDARLAARQPACDDIAAMAPQPDAIAAVARD